MAKIRESVDTDLPAIQAIYAHHVLHGTASFELVPPTVAQMMDRRADVLARGLPYLVADIEGQVTGYAYATLYRPRPAYRYTVEDSVYIRDDMMGHGLGTALLGALIERCTLGGWRQMLAIAGDANPASIALHVRHGFVLTGTFKAVGYKFGAWRDTALLQRELGAGSGPIDV